MRLCNNDDVHLGHLSSLIESDPAFSSEVLMVANGWTYAPRSSITSVMHAIVTLGMKRLQGLCLTVGVRGFLGKTLTLPHARILWRHSLATATIAEELAEDSGIHPDDAYTAGVLHDIGRLGLMLVRPKQYCALLDTHSGTPSSFLEKEDHLFGVNHCRLGVQLGSAWQLPDKFLAGDHHDPLSGDWKLADIIKVSCRLADAAGFPAFPGCFIEPYSDVLHALPERSRKDFHATVEALKQDLTANIEALEAA
jgi:putative nucleotidyltransferase with HDIG domain